MGDFNSDPKRQKKFDKVIQNFLLENKLIITEDSNNQGKPITYRGDNGTESWIDHVICNSYTRKCITKCRVEENVLNTSDHNAITFTIKTASLNRIERKNAPIMKCKNKLDCETDIIQHKFKTYVNEESKNVKIERINDSINTNEKRSRLENNIKSFKKIFLSAKLKIEEESQKYTKERGRQTKSKTWWTEELTIIRREMYCAYEKWKQTNKTDPEAERELKNLKKLFRRKQRQEKYKAQMNISTKLDSLLCLKHKQFWTTIKRNRTKIVEVTAPITDFVVEFQRLFGEEIVKSNEDIETLVESEVSSYNQQIGEHTINYNACRSEMNKIIKSLPNNKSIGHDEISNEMIKYGCNSELNEMWCQIIEDMIKYGISPNNFNIGKIIPILKSNTGPSDNINNIRPITVSDCLSNIFEKFLLIQINKQLETNNKQFGFTKNGSTQRRRFCIHRWFIAQWKK